ncbi:MAG TPA: zinc-ribbon domain-containing protein [Thermoanaerobaculia bacterium]
MADDRYCSNCRAELPEDAESCPECGVYAGDLYDERVHRPKTRFALFAVLLVFAIAAGGAAVWWNARDALPGKKASTAVPPPVRVVGDRPGGARRAPGAVVNEAEAIRLVRRHLVETTGVQADCVAILGQGFRGGTYLVNAHDRCASTRLGKWRVDGKTGAVSRAR